jgi:NAD(P)-dependent dehydrogenase (short-subunit alcohol dehydrogenase family)
MNDRRHALVVGGTGMLRQVSLFLAERGYTVSVVARQMVGLNLLAQAAGAFRGHIVPLALDYRDGASLRAALLATGEKHGQISLAVCWIHSVAPDAPHLVAEVVGSGPIICRYFHIRGSAVADPSRTRSEAEKPFARYPTLHYRQVILGFVLENGRSRWLTDAEISQGVITAIEEDHEYSIVGVVEPWSSRP